MTEQDAYTLYASSSTCLVARSWIDKCTSKHKICNTSMTISPFTFPRRLIDVGAPGSHKPFLVETADLPSRDCFYATLSHRWGDPGDMLQTIDSNINEHYENIPWTALTQTFRDAIVVTQSLGLQYLWIDSLCIVQKNAIDFACECSKMHLIYLHGHVMIAATDCDDSSKGFLQCHNEAHRLPVEPLANTDDSQASEAQITKIRRGLFVDWHLWRRLLDGTLSKRGWALQESHLAPRILYFTDHGILWECRLCIAGIDADSFMFKYSLLGSTYGHTSEAEYDRAVSMGQIFRIMDLQPTRRSLDDLLECWLSLVKEYSSRSLTHFEDRLPAISGLAAAVASVATSLSKADAPRYLAGNWLPDLYRQLFWSVENPWESPLQIYSLAESHLPSWSWASCPCSVTFHPMLHEFERLELDAKAGRKHSRHYWATRNVEPCSNFKVCSSDVRPDPPDVYGTSKGSKLVIQACYLELHVPRTDRNKYHVRQIPILHGDRIDFVLDFESYNIPDSTLRFVDLFKRSAGRSPRKMCGIILRSCREEMFQKIGVFESSMSSTRHSSTVGEMTLI